MKRALFALVVVAGGCFDLSLPGDLVVTCAVDGDCPAGQACAARQGFCVDAADVGKICGDGESGGDEECDDGNDVDDDGCSNACRLPVCGDAIVQLGEVCDDGNRAGGDGCDAVCGKVEGCGDGFVDVGEPCDDGNDNPADGCDACKQVVWRATAENVGPAADIALDVRAIAVDAAGRVVFADRNLPQVRRLEPDGTVTVVAGSPARRCTFDGERNVCLPRGDGGPGVDAHLDDIVGVASDGAGRLYIATIDRSRFDHRGSVRRVGADGNVVVVVGVGSGVETFDVVAIAVDGAGALFFVESSDARSPTTGETTILLRRLGLDGSVSTVAGGGTRTESGVDALDANLFSRGDSPEGAPLGLAAGGPGEIFLLGADQSVRRVADGVLTIPLVGDRFTPIGPLDFVGFAADRAGAVYIAGDLNVRRLDPDGSVATVVGDGTFGSPVDGALATETPVTFPTALAVDGDGRLVLTERESLCRVEPDGRLTTLLRSPPPDGGTPTPTQILSRRVYVRDGHVFVLVGDGVLVDFDVDGGFDTVADLSSLFPQDIVVDHRGRVVYASSGNVLRVEPDGDRQLVERFPFGDTNLQLAVGGDVIYGLSLGRLVRINPDDSVTNIPDAFGITAIAVDHRGRLFASRNNRVQRLEANDTFRVVAGTGATGFGGDGGAALDAVFAGAGALAVDRAGRLCVSDVGNGRVRCIVDGVIDTVAGTDAPRNGDGGPALGARVDIAGSLALDDDGSVYFTTVAGGLRRVDPVGLIATVLGGEVLRVGADLVASRLPDPAAIVVGAGRSFFAGGSSGTVVAVGGGVVDRVAGGATGDFSPDRALFRGDLGDIAGVAFDPVTQTLFLSERDQHVVDAVGVIDPDDAATWTFRRFVGRPGVAGVDDGDIDEALLREPAGLFFDDDARALYVADSGNHVVRRVDVEGGAVVVVAGTAGFLGFNGDGGAATAAQLFDPEAVVKGTDGSLFIADTQNHRVRRVDGLGVISTVFGSGEPAATGDGAPARGLPVDAPRGLAVDGRGNLFVTSTTSLRLLLADDAGVVDGSGAVQTLYGQDRARFPDSLTSCLSGVAAVDDDSVQIVDACTGLLVTLDRVPAACVDDDDCGDGDVCVDADCVRAAGEGEGEGEGEEGEGEEGEGEEGEGEEGEGEGEDVEVAGPRELHVSVLGGAVHMTKQDEGAFCVDAAVVDDVGPVAVGCAVAPDHCHRGNCSIAALPAFVSWSDDDGPVTGGNPIVGPVGTTDDLHVAVLAPGVYLVAAVGDGRVDVEIHHGGPRVLSVGAVAHGWQEIALLHVDAFGRLCVDSVVDGADDVAGCP